MRRGFIGGRVPFEVQKQYIIVTQAFLYKSIFLVGFCGKRRKVFV